MIASPTSRYQRALLAIGSVCVGCASSPEILVGYNLGGRDHGQGGALSAGGTGGGSSMQTAGAGGTSLAATGTGGASDLCSNGGPVIQVDSTGACTTDLARQVFSFAICTCADLLATNRITTDSVASRTSSSRTNAGSIGVNGSYQAEDVASQVGGALWVMGDTRFGSHDIAGDLKCAQSLSVTSDSRVHRNATVAGQVIAPALTIDGSLTVPNGTSVNVGAVRGGISYASPLSIPTPCNCQSPIDIAAIVEFFRTTNDNASQSAASSAFSAVEGNLERSLPCGRYYFESFGGTGSITLHLTGKTGLAIGGDLSNSGGLVLDLGPGAELDLFVDGNLELSGNVTLGNSIYPAATRVYVSGQAAFSANVALYANLYIPNQPLVTSAPSEVWGAIFAQSIRTSGGLSVHYDESILDLPTCKLSGQGCRAHQDCANPTPACRNGTCAACQGDGECSPPLYCSRGLCQLQPIML